MELMLATVTELNGITHNEMKTRFFCYQYFTSLVIFLNNLMRSLLYYIVLCSALLYSGLASLFSSPLSFQYVCKKSLGKKRFEKGNV